MATAHPSMQTSGQDFQPSMQAIDQPPQPQMHTRGQDPQSQDGIQIPKPESPETDDTTNLYRISVHQKITRKPGGAEYHPPITAQPQRQEEPALSQAAVKQEDSMVHPSLRKLKQQERITIQQQCSNYCCYAMNSRYLVKDAKGNPMFSIREESSFGMRCCCCWCRSFTMRIMDNEENEVMRLRRPMTCGQCYYCCGNYCLPFCLSEMDVNSPQPPHRNFGRVLQNFSCFTPTFTCLNDLGQPAFRVTGDCCRFPCTSHYFKVKSAGKESVSLGHIARKWTNCLTECCTNAHLLGIRFQEVTTVEDRIMMLGAAILIDFLYFT